MKNPLYALLIAPSIKTVGGVPVATYPMRDEILTGKKAITIREGHRDYRPGPMLLGCMGIPDPAGIYTEDWAIMATITEVLHTTLGEVVDADWQADGFATRADLLFGLRLFYPTIAMASPVTVIKWNPESILGRRAFEHLAAA